MKSLWNNKEAKKFAQDPLGLRVYTSKLIGAQENLVMHGGGNTSVKIRENDAYGDPVETIYVKASGWDLATIEKKGFAPVRMDALLKMAQFAKLDDRRMVELQRAAMLDPYAANPSVEAILHAIIPFTYVDHTHADAVVTITNTPNGRKLIEKIYGQRVLVVPYVMPGFILARYIYELTKNLDWSKYDGMVLLNHGIFTFHNDARASYEMMVRLVSKAESYLNKHARIKKFTGHAQDLNGLDLARLRREVSIARGKPMLAVLNDSLEQLRFAGHKNLASISQRGPLTPDHVIRTKPTPVVIGSDVAKSVQSFARDYQKYFQRNKTQGLVCLDPAPRFAVWPGHGTVAFGRSITDVKIASDIIRHTTLAIEQAEALGGWRALPEKDIFEMEYWILEQAKLAKKESDPAFQGKIVLVTGAASGIGRACVEYFASQGACVTALDINPNIVTMFASSSVLGLKVDVTQSVQLKNAVEKTVKTFGGLDIIVSNAGIFPPSECLESMNDETWSKSLQINLDSHQKLLKYAIPFLKKGIDPAVIIIASKNVPAPGPGAGAYSVAKAGLAQLGRVAALELAKDNIRVNMIHPNAVFDTGIWTDEVLNKRAKSYGLSVQEYKTNNLLKTEITSLHVAKLAATLASDVFAKTTGAQVPIDGGNDRVI